MKSPIKFLAIIALFFAFTFTANAQRGDRQPLDPEKMAAKETTRMVEKLSLNETQTAQVKEINLTYAKRLQEVQETYKENREAVKEIKTAIDKEKAAELKLVLTAEQFTAFEEMKPKKGRGKRKGGKRERRSRK